jgi:PHD/YefM family antitoxin component YafN of YafNO toxin-antitoxin module
VGWQLEITIDKVYTLWYSYVLEGQSIMENTNPKQLRAELKNFLDLASAEPVRIQRRTGEAFVLMNESQYAQMQNEILSLQRRLLGMSDALAGKGKEYVPGSGARLKRFSNAKAKKKKAS